MADNASEAVFIISIGAGQFGSTGEFQNVGGAECITHSESFRMSL